MIDKKEFYQQKLFEKQLKYLQKMQETNDTKNILTKLENASESYCLKKCNVKLIGLDKIDMTQMNEKEKKLLDRKNELIERCYEICMYKFTQSSIQSIINAQKVYE